MKNGPQMQMSRCDDEDESASSGARHKGGLGLIRSRPVGLDQGRGRLEKACGGACVAQTVSLAPASTWTSKHEGIGLLHPSAVFVPFRQA